MEVTGHKYIRKREKGRRANGDQKEGDENKRGSPYHWSPPVIRSRALRALRESNLVTDGKTVDRKHLKQLDS